MPAKKTAKAPAKKAPAKKVAVKPADKAGEDGLTDLERRFGIEYLVDFNASQAYQRAIGGGVKANSAWTLGSKMMAKPAVQAFIKGKAQALTQKTELTIEATLEQLRRMVMFDPRKLFLEDGQTLRGLDELDDAEASAIAGVEIDELFEGVGENRHQVGYTRKYKLIQRTTPVDLAMKYFGLFEKDNRQKVDPLLELMQQIYGNGDASRLPVKP